MGLSWVSPLYLLGLLLLALPVLIHLLQKHDPQGFKFPSLMFLQQIKLQEKRRLEIRHWWLLLLRCLLLLLIVLAFARPFLGQANDSLGLDVVKRDSVIVIDRSHSMQSGDRWQQAQGIALKLIDDKAVRDRIAVIVFDDSTEIVSDFSNDADKLRSIIKRQQVGLKTTRLRPGLEQAARLLSASNAPDKKILLISDFRAAADSVPVISRDIDLQTFVVDTAVPANVTISGFSILPSTGDAYGVNVDIRNNSVETLRQRISLSLNDREIAGREILLEAGATATVNFDDLNTAGDLVRGEISLQDDALPLDNRAGFIYSSKQQVPVLIVESLRPRINQFLYIEKALQLSRKPVFSVSRSAWSELKAEDLANWAVIIINDVAMPGDEILTALKQYVESGGGLLVASGDNIQRNWPSGEDGFMPGTLMSRIDANRGESNSLPEFSDDRGLGRKIDLSSASIFAYRKLQANVHDRVLARLSGADVALIERRTGLGRVLVLTTTLDMIWNDLAVQPGFVPFLHQTLSYLSAYEPYADRFEVGDVVDVLAYARALAGAEALVADDDLPLVVETPDGSEILLRRQAPLLNLAQPGFYQIHRATRADAKVFLAVNINAQEASLERLDAEQFVAQVNALAEAPVSAAALTQRQAEGYEQQQQLWFTILLVALLTMLVEAFSANWIVGKRPAAP